MRQERLFADCDTMIVPFTHFFFYKNNFETKLFKYTIQLTEASDTFTLAISLANNRCHNLQYGWYKKRSICMYGCRVYSCCCFCDV